MRLRALLPLAALVFPALALSAEPFPALPSQPGAGHPRAAEPSAHLRRRALEELQTLVGQWQAELREFHRDLGERERILARRAHLAELEAATADDDVHLPPTAKVIEVAPSAQANASDSPSDPLEAEIARMEAELEARAQRCAEDQVACEKARELRRIIREGNDAWEEAIEAKARAREAAIEARARQIQAEVDAAQRREAEARAKGMGGRLDDEGRFIDADLEEETR